MNFDLVYFWRRALYFRWVLLFAAIILLCFSLTGVMEIQEYTLSGEIAALEQKHRLYELNQANSDHLTQDGEVMHVLKSQAESRLWSPSREASNLRYFYTHALRFSVELDTPVPKPAQALQGAAADQKWAGIPAVGVGFDLQGKTPLNALLSFLYELTTSEAFLRIDTLTIHHSGKGNTVPLDFKINCTVLGSCT